jgi:hypothetical protein
LATHTRLSAFDAVVMRNFEANLNLSSGETFFTPSIPAVDLFLLSWIIRRTAFNFAE